MKLIIILGVLFVFVIFPFVRCFILNLPKVILYSIKDLIKYIKHKEYNNAKTGNIVAYCGLFGKGKTLSCVKDICFIFNNKNNKLVYDPERDKLVRQRILIMSNVDLNIPFINFYSMEQIIWQAKNRKKYDEENNCLTKTFVLCDEASTQLNSRNFKNNFNSNMLNTLLTCRHHYISFYYTAQRFNHVDALLRQVTSYVVDCNKVWRLLGNYRYDAWEMENATNVMLLSPILKVVKFVRDKDYNAYNTLACVSNLTNQYESGDLLNDSEQLQEMDNSNVGVIGIVRPSRKLKKSRK